MEETTFFVYEGVRVTNTRFVVDGQTYPITNITSVKSYDKKPNRVLPGLLIVLGVLSALNGATAGLFVSLIGAIWWAMQKTMYQVKLQTAGGETTAVNSHQEEYVQKVVTALNDAIVHRG